MAKLKPIKLFLLSVCASAVALPAFAQEEAPTEEPPRLEIPEPVIEEVLVTASVSDIVGSIFSERLNSATVVDLLDADAMARLGDSTVSAALVRVPGLTVVGGKFVYVRGLGERYSSAQLNGAQVPSPDLTRNVIPLDIFPTSILDNVSVQKGYSAEMPAAFGGGNIDIRTKSIPRDFVFDLSVGTGFNDNNGDYGLGYPGGGDDRWGTDDGTRAQPAELLAAIQTYRGDLSPNNIRNTLTNINGTQASFEDAQVVLRELASSLNSDVGISDTGSVDNDYNVKGSLGNKWYFGPSEDWSVGGLVVASYDNSFVNRTRVTDQLDFNEGVDAGGSNQKRSINEVGLTGFLNLGIDYMGEHEIKTNTMYLRNTEDEATIRTRTDTNFNATEESRLRDLSVRFEERELTTNQIIGSHEMGESTQDLLGDNVFTRNLQDASFSWYYSQSKARTDIPNEVLISAVDNTADSSTSVRSTSSAARFGFTDLLDDVESYGWDFEKPWYNDEKGTEIKLAFGWDTSRKARDYEQINYNISADGVDPSLLSLDNQSVGGVFSDTNILDPNNTYSLVLDRTIAQSYLAGQIVDATYGKVDWLMTPQWRMVAGLRWEQYSQATLPINPLIFSTDVGQFTGGTDPEALEEFAFQEDDYYPTLAFTYSRDDGFMNADDFKLRFGWSETVTRPDLRELSNAIYIDPLTEFFVEGNPGLTTSSSSNFDVRMEWYWDEDNFTISGFHKEIQNPIETIEKDISDGERLLGFVNAGSATLFGIEMEGFKTLDFLGPWGENFFVSGNFTWSDSELDITDFVDDFALENGKRPLQGHSDLVTNFQLGWDSPNGQHNATIAFNTFSERLFFAGNTNIDDAYEQPFNSLNATYSYYPTERITVDLKLKNILNDELSIDQAFFRGRDANGQGGTRAETTILKQTVGTSASIGFKYSFGPIE